MSNTIPNIPIIFERKIDDNNSMIIPYKCISVYTNWLIILMEAYTLKSILFFISPRLCWNFMHKFVFVFVFGGEMCDVFLIRFLIMSRKLVKLLHFTFERLQLGQFLTWSKFYFTSVFVKLFWVARRRPIFHFLNYFLKYIFLNKFV